FAEEQGSFLMGIAAALKTETHKLGFVGGFDDERTRRYEAGFVAGAQSVDADILVTSRYIAPEQAQAAIDARNSPTQARTLAEQMLRQGTDVIYQAAGNSGSGVFDALVTARSQGMRDVWAIGSDQDQWLTATEDQKRVILTSMVKQYDNVAYNFIRDYSDRKAHPGTYRATLADHGLSFTLSGGFLVKYKIDDDLSRAEQAIAAGQITVPATLSR
ncbi:MAG TPA: BMP family ABC transporter substrate-binding protein, partial [Mycobacteriales bacterium]|nr:BMP family ABC transporter substrate-binding protein [Mycobacteriales bacterium]